MPTHSRAPTSLSSSAASSVEPSDFASPTGGNLASGSAAPSTGGSIPHTGLRKPTIAGVVVGAVLCVSLLALCVIWLVRKRRTKIGRAPSPFDLYLPQQTLENAASEFRTEHEQSRTSSSSDGSSAIVSTRNLPTDTRPGSESIPNRLLTITEYLARWRATAEQKRALHEDRGRAEVPRVKRDTEFLTAARDELNLVLQRRTEREGGSMAAVPEN